MTPSGIKPATFQLVVQCLNQLRHQQRALKNTIMLYYYWYLFMAKYFGPFFLDHLQANFHN
jgi:hypothetical protein